MPETVSRMGERVTVPAQGPAELSAGDREAMEATAGYARVGGGAEWPRAGGRPVWHLEHRHNGKTMCIWKECAPRFLG